MNVRERLAKAKLAIEGIPRESDATTSYRRDGGFGGALRYRAAVIAVADLMAAIPKDSDLYQSLEALSAWFTQHPFEEPLPVLPNGLFSRFCDISTCLSKNP